MNFSFLTTCRWYSFLLTLLGVVFLLASCGPKIPPKVALPVSPEESRRVLKNVIDYVHSTETLVSARGYAKVRLKAGRLKGRFDEAIVVDWGNDYSRPGRFRFEALDDFGNTRYLLLSDGVDFSWEDRVRREYASQPFQVGNLKKFMPLPPPEGELSREDAWVKETLRFLTGVPRLFRYLEATLPGQERQIEKIGEGRYRIGGAKGGNQGDSKVPEIIWDEGEHAIVSLALKDEGGKLSFRYEAEGFSAPKKSLGGMSGEKSLLIPSRVYLKDYKTQNEIEIHYRDLEVANQSVTSPELFYLSPLSNEKKLDEPN
ncbi:MAG: hypothetical protein U1F57_00965 [bacterium]